MRMPLVFGVSLVMLLTALFTQPVAAADNNAKIQALQQQNAQTQNEIQQLQVESGSIANTITALESDIAALEAEIKTNTQESARLQADLTRLQADLNHQRTVLGENIRSMYIANDMGMMEKLATSKNLSHYVDQEQYRMSMEAKIKMAMDSVHKLDSQVRKQKSAIDKVLADQKAMQSHLQAQKVEKDRLRSLNASEQQAKNQEIMSNNALIVRYRKDQVAQNNKGFVSKVVQGNPNHGGYPYDNVPFPNTLVDPWGMYKRQCVSYTAFRVAQSGRHMPYWGGRGNAKLWDDNARKAGIPVDTKPRVGDVAISNKGQYGHAMYVERVNGDSTISVSQYNASWTGTYSEGRRSVKGLMFIHFPYSK